MIIDGVKFSYMESKVIEVLMQNENRRISYKELMDLCFESEGGIRCHISKINKKLPDLIGNEYRKGYYLKRRIEVIEHKK